MNVCVHAAHAADGGLVILSAWCGRCGQQSMPDRAGHCSWCHRRIVNEDTLSARMLVAQISGREPAAREALTTPPAARLSPAAVRLEPPVPRPGRGRPKFWNPDTIGAAVSRFAEKHGRAPRAAECVARNGLPSYRIMIREFGSFPDAILACGFPRPVWGWAKASGGVDVRPTAAPPPEELLDALRVA